MALGGLGDGSGAVLYHAELGLEFYLQDLLGALQLRHLGLDSFQLLSIHRDLLLQSFRLKSSKKKQKQTTT